MDRYWVWHGLLCAWAALLLSVALGDVLGYDWPTVPWLVVSVLAGLYVNWVTVPWLVNEGFLVRDSPEPRGGPGTEGESEPGADGGRNGSGDRRLAGRVSTVEKVLPGLEVDGKDGCEGENAEHGGTKLGGIDVMMHGADMVSQV